MSLPTQPLKIYVAQMTSTEDVEANEQQILDLLEKVPSSSEGGLVLFPENSLLLQVSLDSFSKEDRRKKAFQLTEPIFSRLKKICADKKIKIILGSLPYLDGPSVFNAMVLVTAEKAEVIYNKIHLFDVDVVGEKSLRESDQYDRGLKPSVIEVDGWKLGLSICYDLRFPELYMEYKKMGVHAILVPAAFLKTTGDAHWHVLLRARAIENQVYVLAPAQGGKHKAASGKERETYGHSLIIDPWGKILAEVESPGPALITTEMQPKELERVQTQIPMASHRSQRQWSPADK